MRTLRTAAPSARPTSRLGAVLVALLGAGLTLGLLAPPAGAVKPDREVVPQSRAHAHNDYNHPRPLLDALSHGFTSVEADVWLVDGKLLVAHDRHKVKPKRTLAALYLKPLRKRIAAHGGSVYRGWAGDFQLLIDVKSEASATYQAIHDELHKHRSMLTSYVDGVARPGAVTAVISGGRDLALMDSQPLRYAGYDGRLSDLDSGLSPAVMPLVSDSWYSRFTWRGVGPMPEEQRADLHDIVERAHAAGYRVRFWGTTDWKSPSRRAVWTELLAAGVDHINTDDLVALKRFLRNHS